jgi:aspartate 1-decarboxylase
MCLNGPWAHIGACGDRLVILAFALVPADEAHRQRPLILTLNEKNQPAGPLKEI